ncbi:hypothetical protein GH714_021119 [Hevea brasiliensis]|uniref:non-specific serine/threonine protein kinase n=1 Tax=Hevea brasiliensis TaxID=3981 RepID=A0A6A6MEA5_HEVBR|nr:hypothetical protein GH714_021119 [Hevea brasiliensis]
MSWLKPDKEWNLFWSQPRVPCESYAYCGAFGSCNGESLFFVIVCQVFIQSQKKSGVRRITMFQISFAAGKISENQSLSGDQTISSEKGAFVLGFFEPGNSSSSYIAIWYNTVSEPSVVWVANRDKPVSDKYSSQLRLSDGNLALFSESNILIWSTHLNPTNSSSLEAVLLDDGNLVLRDGPSSSDPPLWQSFDHPTHTWLPGCKLGLNKITGKSTRLTSWKSKEDPAPGPYSFARDPNGTTQLYR